MDEEEFLQLQKLGFTNLVKKRNKASGLNVSHYIYKIKKELKYCILTKLKENF